MNNKTFESTSFFDPRQNFNRRVFLLFFFTQTTHAKMLWTHATHATHANLADSVTEHLKLPFATLLPDITEGRI